jgi:hypothetical protein
VDAITKYLSGTERKLVAAVRLHRFDRAGLIGVGCLFIMGWPRRECGVIDFRHREHTRAGLPRRVRCWECKIVSCLGIFRIKIQRLSCMSVGGVQLSRPESPLGLTGNPLC